MFVVLTPSTSKNLTKIHTHSVSSVIMSTNKTNKQRQIDVIGKGNNNLNDARK